VKRYYRLSVSEGVVVVKVSDGSYAERIGLQPGDVILKVNEEEISDMKDYKNALRGVEKGDSVLLLLMRGRFLTIFVTIIAE